jgi:hybrid cluster-associated redox disulfide protein
MPVRTKNPATGNGNQLSSFQASKLSRGMRVSDILTLLPNAESLLAQYGLSCYSCAANAYETLEDGCRSHGMPEAEIDDLVTDLNELLKDRPERPQTLSITEPAAQALKELMASQGKSGWGLKVGLDDGGGFAMEFVEKESTGDQIFVNDAVSDVRLFATSLTLASIGGSTIDLREGRFKLDLPSSGKKACACGGTGECQCENGGECACKA